MLAPEAAADAAAEAGGPADADAAVEADAAAEADGPDVVAAGAEADAGVDAAAVGIGTFEMLTGGGPEGRRNRYHRP